MRLIWSTPTFGHADPEFVQAAMVTQMVAANRAGVQWVGVANPDRAAHAAARNMVLDQLVYEDYDAILWCDSDMVPPPQAVEFLVQSGKDFVSGLFFNRRPPYVPTIGLFNDHHKLQMIWDWPTDSIFPVHGSGFAFTLTSRDVIEKLGPTAFENVHGLGEDLSFCWKAKEAGIQMWCHSGVQVPHLGDKTLITPDQWRASREDIQKVYKEFARELLGE